MSLVWAKFTEASWWPGVAFDSYEAITQAGLHNTCSTQSEKFTRTDTRRFEELSREQALAGSENGTGDLLKAIELSLVIFQDLGTPNTALAPPIPPPPSQPRVNPETTKVQGKSSKPTARKKPCLEKRVRPTGPAASLESLLADSVITPGQGLLSISSPDDTKVIANLLPDGRVSIVKEGFVSTPFNLNEAVAMVRNIRVSSRGHTAWQWVEYRGNPLSWYSTGKFVDPAKPIVEEAPPPPPPQQPAQGGVVKKKPGRKPKKLLKAEEAKSSKPQALKPKGAVGSKKRAESTGDATSKKPKKTNKTSNAKAPLKRKKDGEKESAEITEAVPRGGAKKRPRPQEVKPGNHDEDLDMNEAKSMLSEHWLEPSTVDVEAGSPAPAEETNPQKPFEFLRSCGCGRPELHKKRLGSFPIWDDGFFATQEESNGRHSPSNAEGSRARGSRRSREATFLAGLKDLEAMDPHTMISPEPYTSQSIEDRMAGAPDTQPFSIEVHPDAAFVCDFHAHLCESEIIGLLGGYWDPVRRVIYVQAPFPCRSTDRDDDGATDVEMDPASEIQIRAIIESHGLQVVGWYHSHPKFQPDPSVTDILNQQSYQRLFINQEAGFAPFVGLIVGTYDTSMRSPQSIFRYFHVANQESSGRTTYHPRLLKAHVRTFRRGLTDAQREEFRQHAVGLVEHLREAEEAQADALVEEESVQAKAEESVQAKSEEESVQAKAEVPVVGEEPTETMEDIGVKQLESPKEAQDMSVDLVQPEAELGPALETHDPKPASDARDLEETPVVPSHDTSQPEAHPSTDSDSKKAVGEGDPAQLKDDIPSIEAQTEVELSRVNKTESSVSEKPARLAPSAIALPPDEDKDLNEVITTKVQSDPEWARNGQVLPHLEEHGDHLRCVCSSIVPLGMYYARNARRSNWKDRWKQMKKGEKFQRSLAAWVPKMGVEESDRASFVADVLSCVYSFWKAESPPARKQRKRPVSPPKPKDDAGS